MRLDLWLWSVRLYRTRSLALTAIKAGHVKLNGEVPKPAREVHPGELITAVTGHLTRTFKVLGAPASRIGAKLVPQFAEDLTPPEEYTRVRDPVFVTPSFRPKGAGRPTKRERRQIDGIDW